METSVNSELRTASRGDVVDCQRGRDTTNQIMSMEEEDSKVMSKDTDDFPSPEDGNSTKREEFKGSNIMEDRENASNSDENAIDSNITMKKDENISSKLNVLDNSTAAEFDNAVNFPERIESSPRDVNLRGREVIESDVLNMKESKDGETVLSKLKGLDTSAVNCERSAAGLSLELEDLKESYQKMTKERNSLQQKLFEMQSEFCSVEIERDLEKEISRYLEEQISSINSSLLLKENELVSLRKRYKLLNEGFLNSETLREGLERDVSELNKVIRELEERLEISEGNLEAKAAELSVKNAKAKLETEITTLNETLKKERNSKTHLEEMFTNVEKERSLLLKEVEELRSEHQQQLNEVNVLRDLLHEKNKQEQLHHLQGEQFQRQLGEKQQQQSNEIAELREGKTQLSNKIPFLENENKKLEDELYQQLAILEKLEVENKSLAGAEKELEEISGKLKVLGFGNIEQLITENSVLREDKHELERKVRHLEHEISTGRISKEKLESNSSATSKDCLHFGVNPTKFSCVPKSEYLKLKFQLKSLADELKTLKQASEPKNVKGRRSRKHENSMAKKWLKTMKDGINAVANEDDFVGERCGTVFLGNQLHEANIRVDALQHELEISRKENEVLVSTKKKREEEMEVLKRRLVEIQETHNSSLKEMKMKLQKAEKNLEDEGRKVIGMEEKITYLEEHNQEMCIELERIKEKFQSSQKEKERTRNELESFKHDILENFGSLSIQSVCNSLTLAKVKSVEYIKIIEANKSNLAKLTQELNSLQQVNTVLREELNDARGQLEKKDEEISKKYLTDSISQKRESDRLQAVMQALESSKQNEAELLAMYTKGKREWEKLHGELMKLNSELQETKILLSEKEKECETTNRIMRELEATCEVYEVEFEKAATVQENENRETKENGLSLDESQDELSDSGSDSTADNFREMQEALQERMTVKVKRLQNRLEETLAALSSCQKMNIDLQKKLHEAEKRNLEKGEIDGRTPDKEFIETILKKLSEKEEEIQEILQTNSSAPEDGKQEWHTENNLDELLSHSKETIKQLKIDNAKNEVRLAEANERIAGLEDKLAMYQNFREDHTRIQDGSNNLTFESAVTSKDDLIEVDNVAINDNLKAELDSTTAKYVNLKAAFEGCLRRLRIMEEGEDGVETEEAGTVNEVERYKSSDVEGMVMPKFISPLQEKKTKTAEVQTGFQETSNFEKYQETQAIKSSSFSEISCAFLESDLESESIGSDRMVIELTLTENDMDSLEIPGTYDEFLQERLEYENEFGRLRARIIELEKLNSTTTSEIHRVEEYSFKERVDLECKLRSLQQLNNMMNAKLDAVEVERDSLEERANQSDIGHSEATQELQRIKISTAKEQQATENTIKGLKNQENTLKKRIVKMEWEKDELRMTIKELHGNVMDFSQETEHAKNEFHNQGENYRNVFTEFEHEIEVYKQEKESDELKISELKRKVCVFEDEIRKSKDENLKLEESIKKFEGVIFNLGKQNTDLKCEKENAFRKNGELEHRNEVLVKNQELNMASILTEKEGLENKIIQLQTTITTLEETLVRVKTDLTCKIRTENEQSEILLSERKKFEDTRKQLQEKVMILEKEMEELNSEKINSEAIVKELEEKIGLLNEEKERRIKALSNEKQSLEVTSKEFQIMITELNERYMIENMEKDNTISLIRNESLSLKVENAKLQSHVSSYVDEIQQIKSTSFNGRQKLEAFVTNLQETNVSMKKVVDEDRQAIEHLNLMINDFEAKCLYLQKELERVKICSFNENQLEDKIEKLTEALSSIEIKFEDLKLEKDHLVSKEKELDQVIWKLQEELQRVKVCAFEERQNMVTKAENYNVLAEEGKTNFEYQILERDRQISSLKLTVSELDGFRKTLENDQHMQDEEICAFKIREEGFQHEIKRFETNVVDYENQISTLRKTLGDLNEEKRSLETKVLQRDEELSSVQKVVDELQDEKKQLDEKIVEKDEHVSLLELNVAELEKQTNTLENDALQSSKEKSTAQVLLENLEKQKKLLKDDVVNCKSQIALLKRKASQLEEEKQCLTTSIDEKDRELRITEEKHEDDNDLRESNVKQSNEISLLKKNVSQLQVEREDFTNCINVQADELSDLRAALEKLESERNVLKEDNVKQTNEMSSLETTVAEIDNEKECLAGVIAKQDEELSSFKMTLDKLQEEKKDLQDHIKNCDNEILLLKENVSRLMEERESYVQNAAKHDEELSGLKINTTKLEGDKITLENEVRKRDGEILSLNERVSKLTEEKDSYMQNAVKKEEELTTKLQEGREILEEKVLKCDTEIALSESNIFQLEEEKVSLANDIAVKEEELSVMKISVGNLEKRNNVLEEEIIKRDNDISLQESSIGELEKDKESLVNDIAKKDEEIIVVKLIVENLQVEIKAMEEHNINQDNKISLIQTTLVELWSKNQSLVSDIAEKDEELSAVKNALGNIQNEKKAFEEQNFNRDNEISLLKTTLLELEKEKESMANDIALRDEELSLIKITIQKLEEENKFREDVIVKRDDHISLQGTSIAGLEEEKECLANDIATKDEKLSVMEATVEKLQNEKKEIEENNLMKVTLLETRLIQLEKENESLTNDIGWCNEELFACKETMGKFEAQRKVFENDIMERDSEILLLKELNLSKLREEKESFANDIGKRDEELYVCKEIIEKLDSQKEALENDIMERNSEILLLKQTISKLEEENESAADDIINKDEQLSDFDITVEKLKNEKKALQDDIVLGSNEISLLEARLARLQNEKESIVNDLSTKDEELSVLKMTVEKLQHEKKILEEDIMKHDEEIQLVESALAQLENEKESFVDDIVKKDEELTVFKMTVEELQHENEFLEDDATKKASEIQLLESRLVRTENENKSLLNDHISKDEEVSVLKMIVEKLQHENEALEVDVMKRGDNMSQQEADVARLQKENQTLGDNIVAKDEELSGMKIKLEKMQSESKSLEDYIVKCDSGISLLKDEISKLQDEKDSLANNLLEQFTVDELENEKNPFEDENLKHDSGISLLESKVFSLESEKEGLSDDITRKNEKLSAFIETIEKFEDERKRFESKIAKDGEEILSLRYNVHEIAEVKRSLEIDLQRREEELLSTRETLRGLQDENKFLENNEVELNEKFSHYTIKIERYQEEISLLRNGLQKVTTEKESVENKMKEINEKSKCDEEDFDKLIAGYLQEIDSWKKGFGSMEEAMTALGNEMEKLQYEKEDLENIIKEMSESERASEEMFQENIKMYYEDIDSWKVKVQDLESDAEFLRKTVQKLEHECESRKLEINRKNDEKEKSSKLQQEMVTTLQKEREHSEKQWLLEKEKEIGNLRFELETKLQMMESQYATKVKELHDRNGSMEQLKDDVCQLNNVLSKKDEEILNLKSKVVELEETTLEENNRIHGIQQQDNTREHDLKLSRICVEELREDSRKLTEIISGKEEKVFTLANEIKGLSERNKELEESKLSFIRKQENYEDELQNLRDMLKSFEAKELAANDEMKLTENELNRLRNELSAIQQQNSEDEKSENSVKNNIEKSRERLRILLADIDETTKIKVSVEEELRVLHSKLEQQSEEKTKLEMNVFCLKEITDELTKGKMTLLEEIARLSDQKKEGQEFLNSEFARLRISNNDLQNNKEKIERENSELIVRISSLKVTLATVQSAYEQTQDEIKNHKMRLDEALRREKHNNQEREKIDEKYKKTEVQLKHLEERYRSTIVENKDLSSSLNETRKRLESLEKEIHTIKSENVILLERVKQQGSGENDESLDNGKSSTQALRKKLKEFRAKLSEEKKQRELHEFEIKNLKEKVERFTKKDKENEVRLEDTRKKLLEVKTERDGLLMDIDSLNKRKKKDIEGYTSKIETLEDDLRLLKGKESKKAHGKQTKETINVLNEEKKILELKLTSNQQRHHKEVTELRTALESLQNRYTTELKRFEATEAANRNEILALNKSLTSFEREHESRGRELEKIRANLVAIKQEKEKIERVLSEKNNEVNKWKKEALNDKAEIKFLRGSLNILGKEGLVSQPTETHDRHTE